MIFHLKEALETIRMVRNNTSFAEFQKFVKELVEKDANLRYPLLLAGQVAEEVHSDKIRKLNEEIYG